MNSETQLIRGKPFAVGLDVDGVLANFNAAYADLLTDMHGKEFPDYVNGNPTCWNWDAAAGLTKGQINATWEVIKSSLNFWRGLKSYPGVREFLTWLNEWSRANNIYVVAITNRMGADVSKQTALWLKAQGLEWPAVIVSKFKAVECRNQVVTHYIDDNTQNCQDVRDDSFAKVWMLAKPYNEKIFMVPRIDSLDEFKLALEVDLKETKRHG